MLQGKIHAAMRWISERSKGSVLLPSDDVTVTVNGKKRSVPVTEALIKAKAPSLSPSSLFYSSGTVFITSA